MREAAETLDDLAVALRIAQQIGAEGRAQLAGEALVVERFAVFKGEIGEQALVRRQFRRARQQPARRRSRRRIGGESAGLAAKHVAGKLVKENDQREAFARRAGPRAEPPG